ncbi:hypothetical protein AMS68_004282 [Peltaster fructicola]|uniref:Ubiquitin-like modifier-activating enzyme ATG7 n=1 Tax=Peltaster fructicola TaxID=286661 RepID=A0A6H0XVT1_9PEZI|nr:hypothetical protein AMS68_004282 [Peltaster fructicola]
MSLVPLQYAPWLSDVELSFFSALASIKINHDKLDSSARKLLGLYEINPKDPAERSTRMQIHGNALTADESSAGYYRAEGMIRNYNTIEEFRQVDRTAHIEQAGKIIWDAINDGTIYSCPSLLASFSVICFADLKKYKFTYHFAFPALHSDPQWRLSSPDDKAESGLGRLEVKETVALVESIQTWRYSVDVRQHGFFLAKRIRLESPEWQTDNEPEDGNLHRPKTPTTPSHEELGFKWVIGALASFQNNFFANTAEEDRFVCFADPSTYSTGPAWMLRNLLVLVRNRWRLNKVQILCYRDTHIRRDQPASLVMNLQSAEPVNWTDGPPIAMPKITGWERNETGRGVSRTVDLAAYLDPARLADQAVDLNLKLIKWRISPSLDLERIKDTKCLLLGAGTLGSYVARNLMGWGVRKITFLDNGKVSYSNPVRQPLYEFSDCVEGGKKKAERAAEKLKEIYPGVQAHGESLTVPMAGHALVDEAKTKRDFERLQELVKEHDAIFLLMDTRESRWLPTVMGKAEGKIVINAALGFDTYVVMRHGVRSGDSHPEPGCYFCTDVVAPADSLKSATLDQQCTVTRPGAAPIASALAVELLVSITQHRLGKLAPAPSLPPPGTTGILPAPPTDPSMENSHPLGTVPHTLRGYMSTWQTIQVSGRAYDACAACSPGIVKRYSNEGWDFVKRAISQKGFVEEVSGLAEVQRKAEEAAKAMDDDDDDDDNWGEEDGEGELV